MSQRTILINISGDSDRLIAVLERYRTWPRWKRWLWRHGLIGG